MSQLERTFEDKPAVRESVPLMLGLVGPSHSGKTKSALRLAAGIQRVTGGDIYMADSEARRGLHYAESHKFRHVAFSSPFSPRDYLAVIRHCVAKGARIMIVDSTSHEHEGPGGVLEWHDAECERLMKAWKTNSREKVSMPAWGEPKRARRELINAVLQMECHFIFCFRAKEKIKIVTGKDPIHLGWMPLAGEEFIYEMTQNFLLPPLCNGVPDLFPKEPGSKEITKIPEQFRGWQQQGMQLNEEVGERLARWARGVTGPTFRAGPDTGKSLTAATPDQLLKYKEACSIGIAKKSGAAADDLRAHIAEIDTEIESRARADERTDDPLPSAEPQDSTAA
jgi:hypothetical protein